MKKIKTNSASASYFTKWFLLMTLAFVVGTAVAFAILNMARHAGTNHDIDFNPFMLIGLPIIVLIIVAPFAIFILRRFRKHFDTITKAMNDVANGETDVSIPVTDGAFKGIYKDFNKMVAEIAGIQKLRDEITGSFSHELKTPIASITGFAKMLLEEDLPEKKRKEYLAIIVKESDRLASLTNKNLLLSKIGTQEIVIGKKPYNLGQQIQEITIAMETAWASKNINISADLPDVTYNGSANLMESLWQNLLSNAIKFTPKNGEIDITLTETDDSVTVTFADTGIGMSDEVKAKVFERFYQADTSHSGEGHGLGLSIASRIVRLCGGQVTVESKEGEGSTFTVILPKNVS